MPDEPSSDSETCCLPRTFRRWLRGWFLLDVVGLGFSVPVILYFAWQQGPWKDIWFNLGFAILGGWISARIIGSLIDMRAERDRVRGRVIGNLNFMMGVCQDLPPQFYSWRINDFENEVRWFRERQNSPLGRKQLAKFFSKEEGLKIETVLEHVTTVQSLIKPFRTLLRDFRRLADSDLSWSGPPEAQFLIKATRRLSEGDPEDEHDVESQLAAISAIGQPTDQTRELAKTVSDMLASLRGLREAISRVETTVAELRKQTMADH